MTKLRAIVRNGRLIMDQPTALPEGLVLDLVADDEGDDLDDESKAALHRSILEGIRQIENGEGRPVSDVVADLRKRRE